jgi:hypothetical protein
MGDGKQQSPLRALLLKEWLKCRWFFCGALVVNFGGCLFFYLELRSLLRLEHAEMVWYRAAHLDTVFFLDLRWLPLLAGVVVAAAQGVPELRGRRLRLMLHLPLPVNLLFLFWLLSGSTFYLVIGLMDLVLVVAIMRHFFPADFVMPTILTLLPWLLAGWFAYGATLTVLLEPNRIRQIFLLAVGCLALPLFLAGSGYGWSAPALPGLALLVPAILLGVYLCGHRCREKGEKL